METAKKALEDKANEILQKEAKELKKILVNNKLANLIKITFGNKEIPLCNIIEYDNWGIEITFENIIKNSQEKRKEEIIKELLENFEKNQNKQEGKQEEKNTINKKQIINEFLEEKIKEYSKNIDSTIEAVTNGHIQSASGEIELYKDIIISLNFLKSKNENI